MTFKTIGDFVELQRGTTYKSSLLGLPGPYLLGLGSIGRDGGFRDEKLKTYGGTSAEKILVHPGDIYVSLKDVTQNGDLLGAVAKVPLSINVGRLTQDTVKLIFKNKIDENYFYWVLRTPQYRDYCRSHATGTTNLGLAREDFFKFRIPELTVNRSRIATVLNGIEKKIEANLAINSTLESLAQILFKSWFINFEPVKAKIAVLDAGGSQEEATLAAMTATSGKDADSLAVFEREYPEKYAELKATAELFPSTMQESELGDIPAGWSSQRMSNIATLHYGKALKKTERIDGPYPVYGSGGVTGSHNGYLVEGPGIIVGRKGSIGTIYWEDGKFHPIDTVYYVATKEEIPLSYLYYLMKTLNLPSMNTDAAVPGLNRDNVYRLEVLKPTQSILNKFDNHIATIRNGIQKNNNTIVSLVGLRDTLLPKLLSGEIPLPEAEELAKEADYV
ncbi:TPA: restriction endonuclease subunit S [Raoultella planticola]|uniref:restriction endonuclease subunit S n=1 Tax=Citrobacter freundii TaxID=546 RepID=UPI001A322534|nr:restriction endonuclease subunit S [Citrobacter freundii]MDV1152869.1 restriction endonuclease subunit S [Citrobacter freundii]MEB0499269.1 restriction endonuclease subunit S [Citrobacter freundii]HAT1630237.1 restriction endonuclease subunit S [Raoultella planticola]